MSTQALDGKVFKHAFKFSDLGLDLGEETALKNVSWNPGRPHRPAEGDYLIDNPNYDPNDSSFGPEQIINPDYISEILEVKAQGTYEVDLKVPLTINGNTFSFSLGSQSPTGRYLNQPGGSSAPDDLKVKDLAPTYRNSILSKLDEIFEKPDQILQEMATNINELNIGVGAFVEVVDDEYQLTLIADGSKDIPELKTQDTAIEMETIVQTAAEIDLTDDKLAQKAVIVIDQVINSIDSQRAQLGALQNRFDNTISNLQNIRENTSAARGRIQDTDFASETAALSKRQIMQQAGTAILAQANQIPSAVLSLLR